MKKTTAIRKHMKTIEFRMKILARSHPLPAGAPGLRAADAEDQREGGGDGWNLQAEIDQRMGADQHRGGHCQFNADQSPKLPRPMSQAAS